MENTRKVLINQARKAKKNAYSPYSKFKVGAALKTSNGKIYSGCNVENISYGLSNCAERTAVFKAVSEGIKKIDSIAISSSGKKPAFPCGACRQVLVEFNPNMTVYIDGLDETFKISELLIHSFDKKQLKY
ncbi:MAG: cytidine deaminase [Nitrosopumilus sp.]|nr:cytidine deaminase [Nitrosopumilus sp.]